MQLDAITGLLRANDLQRHGAPWTHGIVYMMNVCAVNLAGLVARTSRTTPGSTLCLVFDLSLVFLRICAQP